MPTPKKRVRIIQVVLQPVLVTDDGTDLTPLELQGPLVVAGKNADSLTERLAEAVLDLETQLNKESASSDSKESRKP